MVIFDHILLLIAAYLTGSISSAVWVGKLFYNKDVREYGSGNAGATNTFRVLGKNAGIPVLLMDIMKGWLSVHYVVFLGDSNLFAVDYYSSNFEIQLTLGIAAILGHLFPIYTGFRGGKGIATILGILFALHAWAALSCIVVFILIFLMFKYISLASIISSLFFPISVFFMFDFISESLNLFSIFVPILSLITHQKNIERLFRGEENKYTFGKNKL